MSGQEPSVTQLVTQLQVQVAQLSRQLAAQQAVINTLQARLAAPDDRPTPANVPPSPPTRRRMLRYLAGALVTGLGVAAAATPAPTQAGFTYRDQAGAIVVRPDATVFKALPPGSLVALVGSGDSSTDLSQFTALNNYSAGIFGYSSSLFGVGVLGQSPNGPAMLGYSQSNGIGVAGQSFAGRALLGISAQGATLHLDSRTDPPPNVSGGYQAIVGDFSFDATNSKLYVCVSTSPLTWRSVTFV